MQRRPFKEHVPKPKLLLVAGNEHAGDFLRHLLRLEGFKVEVHHVENPLLFENFQDLDIIVLDSLGTHAGQICDLFSHQRATHTVPIVVFQEAHEPNWYSPSELERRCAFCRKPFRLHKGEPIETLREVLPVSKQEALSRYRRKGSWGLMIPDGIVELPDDQREHVQES